MIMNQDYAIPYSKGAIIVSSENGNEHRLFNDSPFPAYQFRIDGEKNNSGKPKAAYAHGTQPERCDFVVEIDGQETLSRLYVIELKGSNLLKALSQIATTIQSIQKDKSLFSGYNPKLHVFYPRVVIHRVNTHAINQAETLKFKKEYPNLVIKCKQLSEKVSAPAK